MPFRQGYRRSGFYKPSIDRYIEGTLVPARQEKRSQIPKPSDQKLQQYYRRLQQKHDPQWNYVSPNELYAAYRQSPTELRQYAGSSNLRKYGPNKVPFCGPAGGAALNTYPISNRQEYISAKRYARNAPNPQGIRDCAEKAYGETGY